MYIAYCSCASQTGVCLLGSRLMLQFATQSLYRQAQAGIDRTLVARFPTFLPAPRALPCPVERQSALFTGALPTISLVLPDSSSLLVSSLQKRGKAQSWKLGGAIGYSRMGEKWSLPFSVADWLGSLLLGPGTEFIWHLSRMFPSVRRQLGVHQGLKQSSFWELPVTSKNAVWTPSSWGKDCEWLEVSGSAEILLDQN